MFVAAGIAGRCADECRCLSHFGRSMWQEKSKGRGCKAEGLGSAFCGSPVFGKHKRHFCPRCVPDSISVRAVEAAQSSVENREAGILKTTRKQSKQPGAVVKWRKQEFRKNDVKTVI